MVGEIITAVASALAAISSIAGLFQQATSETGRAVNANRLSSIQSQANQLLEKIRNQRTVTNNEIAQLNSILTSFQNISIQVDPRLRSQIAGQISKYSTAVDQLAKNVNVFNDMESKIAGTMYPTQGSELLATFGQQTESEKQAQQTLADVAKQFESSIGGKQ